MADTICKVCEEALPADNCFVTCKRGCKLHFDKCSGMTASSWKTLSTKNKNAYVCRECRESGAGSEAQEMKSLLKEVLAKVSSMEAAMKTMHSKHEQVLTELAEQGREIARLKTEVASLNQKLEVKDQELESLKTRIRDHEQYTRNRNIIISGVECTEKEDLMEIMDSMAGYLNIPNHSRDDIDILHRLPASKKDPNHPKIVVLFKTRSKRDLWLLNKRHGMKSFNLVSSGKGNKDETSVFINEHLTREWQDLLMSAKAEGRKYGYNIVWFKKDRIRAKKAISDTKFIQITSKADFAKFCF